MKTKIKLRLAGLSIALFLCGFKSQAQFFCDNMLNCDVTIQYEMWEYDAQNICVGVCGATFLVPANSTGNILPICTPNQFCDVCIIITDIGGWAPPSNHSSNGIGHIMTPFGQTGTTGASMCNSGTPFTALQSFANWVIN